MPTEALRPLGLAELRRCCRLAHNDGARLLLLLLLLLLMLILR